MTSIDPWFLEQVQEMDDMRAGAREASAGIDPAESSARCQARRASPMRDSRSWRLEGTGEHEKFAHLRKKLGVQPVFNRVDTCAAEFESFTPYLYSSYEAEGEAAPTTRKKVMILGSGPNRIGQGIEFDYCCCHASFALQEDGVEIDHGQLQSGDGLDRLRHQRPPVLRAAHARRRV